MMGLKEFLVSVKAKLDNLGPRPRVHIVIGNEACDLDSTISAVSYAYFLHTTKPTSDTVYLPVMNIPREEFRLRLETLYFLNKHDIRTDNLVFTDDLDLVAMTQNEDTVLTVTLVDHHELIETEQCLASFVVEVLDHRPQAGILPESWRPHIERVGSCCTLVARKMLASEDFTLDLTLAELLLGTILMDTGNLSAVDGVATAADQDIVLKLQSYLSPESTADSIFEGIRDAKNDLSSLRVLEILYKDLKVLKGVHITVAMASVTMKLEDLFSRSEFSHDCEQFCSTLPADVLVIMTLWKEKSGLSLRGVAVFSLSRIYREQITDVLLSSVSPNLELQQMTVYSHIEHVSTFVQNNVQVFRKGVLPLIKKFLAGESTTPDENLNAADNLLQDYSDLLFDSASLGDLSEEEVRRHINLAKTYQSDQFRTSQDRYDLAAVGMEPVISPSLSSDSEFSSAYKRRDEEEEEEGIHRDEGDYVSAENKDDDDVYESSGAYVDVKPYGAAYDNLSGAGDGDSNDTPLGAKDVFSTDEGAVNPFQEITFEDHAFEGHSLKGHGFEGHEFERTDFEDREFEGHELEDNGFESVGFESHDENYFAANDNPPQSKTTVDLMDFSGGDNNFLSMSNNVEAQREFEHSGNSSINFISDSVLQDQHSSNEKTTNPFIDDSENDAGGILGIDNYKQDFLGDDFQEYSPYDILGPDNVDSPLDFSSMPTSNQTSGQGSKMPSYPETPPNSCVETSSVVMNKETQLPSFNSSEMVRRIQEKKAALVGHQGPHAKSQGLDDVEGLFVTGEGSSGGGGSLISPAVPQNSFMDPVRGFDFQSSSNQLPKLMNSDFVERVSEKRSQFEWSVESLEGSTSGVDVGPNSEGAVQQASLLAGGAQHISVRAGADHQVPYTPQNSYVDEQLDTYARSSLPSLNSAEIVAKIKAKQSAMFGSGSSSRVSRSSHGSDDSGGCASPDVADKSPREASLDSPQAPYTPQNSFRDNLVGIESRNHLPDLNEVAERLSTGNILKHQFGKRSASNSGGGSHDEENINLNITQQSHRRYGRNSSSQSDSQNTMSDVDSLMSVSTDIATPSDNIVATVLASQMRNEIALLSRKDTHDSDVFPALKTEESSSNGRDRDSTIPKVSPFDLVAPEKVGGATGMTVDKPSGDNASSVVNNGYSGAKELFSPLDSSKVRSIEEHAIFEAAESIVAQSVAAAVESSKKIMNAGGFRKESRLRWHSDVEPVVSDDHRNLRFVSQDVDDEENDTDDVEPVVSDDHRNLRFVSQDVDEEENDTDDDTTGDISESLPDNGLDTVVSQNEILDEPWMIDLHLSNSPQNSELHAGEQPYFDNEMSSENIVSQKESPLEMGSEAPGCLPQADAASFSLTEQSLASLVINELAFEQAKELIEKALDDFPFNQDVSNDVHGGDGALEVEQGNTSTAEADAQESATGVTQPLMQLDSAAFLDGGSQNVVMQNVCGNNASDVSGAVIQPHEITTDFEFINRAVPKYIEDILNSSASTIVGKDFQSASKLLSSTKQTDFSTDSNSLSSSLERNKSRDPDLSMTIMENEIRSTFPERKTSAEFTALEEEDIIHSFPGRKFSRSEDYPSRRFSREENSSRRSSRLEDQDLEVTIRPEDIETDYLPNMDPLQGNMDIIDSSFSKITDGNREVVEGESFRKISRENFVGSSHRDEDDESEVSEERDENDPDVSNDYLYTGAADKSEPDEQYDRTDTGHGLHEFVNISSELEAQSADNSHEIISKSPAVLEGHTVDIANVTEFPISKDSEKLGKQSADIPKQSEGQPGVVKISQEVIDNSDIADKEGERVSNEDVLNAGGMFSAIETYAADSVNPVELQPRESSKDFEETAASHLSSEPDFWSRENSRELEVMTADICAEPRSILLVDRITEKEESLEVIVPKQKKKIRVSFSEDFDEEIGDFNITSISRSPLKSPPPLPSAEDSGSSSSSVENLNSILGDEDKVAPLSAVPTQGTPSHQLQKKEIYHTSAGRISISLGEESEGSSLLTDVAGSLQLTSFTDQIIGQGRAQLEEMIESAKWTISEADEQLVVKDDPPHSLSSSSPFLDSPVSQTAHDVDLMPENESNSVIQPFVANFDSLNFDLSAVNSNPLNETNMRPIVDNHDRDHLSESEQQQQLAASNLSHFDSMTSDPFASLPTHVRNLSTASTGSFQGAVYSEEWQDDDIAEVAAQSGIDASPKDALKKKLVPEPSSAETEEAVTDNDVEMEDSKNEEDQDSEDSDLEWENDTPVKTPARPGIEPTLTGEPIPQEAQRWKTVSVSGFNFDIDMQAVEPYRNVLSHGGYYDEGLSAIIVFYGCNLPSTRSEDYAYIMNHLFHYVIHTLEELVADDYVIIYFHGSTPRRQMPSLGWLKRCYQSIDRRLRKNLKGLFLVHPTLWLRTVVMMTKPFISTKFTSKLRFVRTLEELNALVPLNNVAIPEAIVHFDIHHRHLPTPPASPYHFPSS